MELFKPYNNERVYSSSIFNDVKRDTVQEGSKKSNYVHRHEAVISAYCKRYKDSEWEEITCFLTCLSIDNMKFDENGEPYNLDDMLYSKSIASFGLLGDTGSEYLKDDVENAETLEWVDTVLIPHLTRSFWTVHVNVATGCRRLIMAGNIKTLSIPFRGPPGEDILNEVWIYGVAPNNVSIPFFPLNRLRIPYGTWGTACSNNVNIIGLPSLLRNDPNISINMMNPNNSI